MPAQGLVLEALSPSCSEPGSGAQICRIIHSRGELCWEFSLHHTLSQITGSPSGEIKALCVLLSRGTGGKSFPPLIITNQRIGELVRGFISFIGGFPASRVLLVAVDGAGRAQAEGSRGNLCPPWLWEDTGLHVCFLCHVAAVPGARKPEGLAGTAERLQPNNWIAHSPTPLMQSQHTGDGWGCALHRAPHGTGKLWRLPGSEI